MHFRLKNFFLMHKRKLHFVYYYISFGSSRPEVFLKKGVLRNFTKFTRKHLYRSLFFNKVTGNFIKKETLAQVFSCEFCEIAGNFIKKETLAQVLSCEFCEISKNTFFLEHLRWLLLIIVNYVR